MQLGKESLVLERTHIIFMRPLFLFNNYVPVAGSMGLEPLGIGLPFGSKTILLLGGGKVPSALGLGGRPLLFLPVSGSTLISKSTPPPPPELLFPVLSDESLILNSEFIFANSGTFSFRLFSFESVKTTSVSSNSAAKTKKGKYSLFSNSSNQNAACKGRNFFFLRTYVSFDVVPKFFQC